MSASRLSLKFANELRSVLWRVGRKLYCVARGDQANRPETNGEYWLLDQFLGHSAGDLVFFDVGANKGEWTLRALEVAARRTLNLSVHAFEPCTETRALLTRRLSSHGKVEINANALSSLEGETFFYSGNNRSGTNSLSEVSGSNRELVRMTTLDSFAAENRIDHIDMLKIDTEGFDFEVLKGSERLLTSGLIEVVQFEYNWRWLINHNALRDVFEYIRDKPYSLGKLVGSSIELFDEWHFELDRYFENNYVLLRNGSSLLDTAEVVRFDERNCARRIDKASKG